MAKKKIPKFDGLGTVERKKISNAIRQVWYRSHSRKLAIKRCTDKEGYAFCEKCKKRTPKIKIDHINPVGPVESHGFIDRLFTASLNLQGLCKQCHDAKTKTEKRSKSKTARRTRDQSPLELTDQTPEIHRNQE